MHKNATKCNEILSKWCINKHGASKIMDTFETYHVSLDHTNTSKITRNLSINKSAIFYTSKISYDNEE
jgi:hypothetical protein